MLLFVYTTTHKTFVIFTCSYFKLSWNTTALSQSNCRNFSSSSITESKDLSTEKGKMKFTRHIHREKKCSVIVLTIYCFNPKLRLFFVRNWVLLNINENDNRCPQLSRCSYYRFTFLCLSLQKKQIVKVLWISSNQTLLRGKTRRFQGFFMDS